MPGLQELLVSYAVRIDESGVTRLHSLLDQNRKKAADTAAAFERAEKSIASFGKTLTDIMKRFPQGGSLLNGFLQGSSHTSGQTAQPLFSSESKPSDSGQRARELSRFASVLSESIRTSVSTVTHRTNTYTAGSADVSGPFPLQADTSPVQAALEDLNRFITEKTPTMRLKGDASGLVAAASNAASRIRSILSDLALDLGGEDGPGKGGGSPAPVMHFSSAGGRFDLPTTTQVAEDGEPEYIIPVRKEKKAVPLIMQMMGELSFTACHELMDKLGMDTVSQGLSSRPPLTVGAVASVPDGVDPVIRQETSPAIPRITSLHAAGNGLLSGVFGIPSLSSFASGLTVNNRYEISAPCTIQVHSTGTDAKQVGEAAYHAAERQLLKSIRGVFQ